MHYLSYIVLAIYFVLAISDEWWFTWCDISCVGYVNCGWGWDRLKVLFVREVCCKYLFCYSVRTHWVFITHLLLCTPCRLWVSQRASTREVAWSQFSNLFCCGIGVHHFWLVWEGRRTLKLIELLGLGL